MRKNNKYTDKVYRYVQKSTRDSRVKLISQRILSVCICLQTRYRPHGGGDCEGTKTVKEPKDRVVVMKALRPTIAGRQAATILAEPSQID
ncbi:hypothetical protein WA026_020972 [Henosepilachna vigintioctopunctata]|uniref:Uncharacterized protein n=1 Tax=Henosepilachna vigintioctopunctata TaxID=420089 RepID=A0AAW1VF35_9CUCU